MCNEDIKTGTIVKLSGKGFGFIKDEEDNNYIFFHARSVVDPEFDALRKGIIVNYLIEDGRKGKEARSIVTIPQKAKG